MTNEYKNKKRDLIKKAIADLKEELDRTEIALDTNGTASHADANDPEKTRKALVSSLESEIQDTLAELATLYKELKETY